jgi:hypothetical protein
MDRDEMSNLYREPSIDASYQVCFVDHCLSFLAHLAKGNVSFCHHLVSVNFLHFNLLRNPLAVSEENIFFKSANQKQELPVAAMFVNGSGRNEQSL